MWATALCEAESVTRTTSSTLPALPATYAPAALSVPPEALVSKVKL
jgi:hypothetical protein